MTRLDEIRKRVADATPRPWKQTRNIGFGVKIWGGTNEVLFAVASDAAHARVTVSDQVPQWQKDCDFVRASRTDIPYLLERLEAAELALRRINSLSRPALAHSNALKIIHEEYFAKWSQS